MPGYKKHLLYSIPILLSLLTIQQIYAPVTLFYNLIAIPLFMFYTLLPDIDIPSSKVRRIVEVGALISTITLLIYVDSKAPAIIMITFILILWFVKHRGVFHNPLLGIILSAPAALYNVQLAVICYVAFLTHLALDRTTH